MFEYVMGMDGVGSGDVTASLVAGAADCPVEVVAWVRGFAAVAAGPVSGDVVTGAGLADRVTVLARLRTVLDAEIARTLVAAQSADVLPHTAATHLQRHAAWSGADASEVLTAGRFAARHRDLAVLWRSGQVSAGVVAVIARGLRGVSAEVEAQFLAAVLDKLPRLSVKAVKVLLARTLDLLFPHDADAREQTDWDRRSLVATTHGGMTMISADLPAVEGQAVMAALDAVADSLRVAGDRTTAAQRRADALITLVNAAHAHGDVPTTRAGLPVATTITVGIAEADRVAAGKPKTPTTDLTQDVVHTRDPRAVATTSSDHGGAVTLGDAALRFALCTGTHTGVLIDDRHQFVGNTTDDRHQPHTTADDRTADSGRPVSSALTRTRVQPLAVGRAFRLATPAQRTALAVRDRGCVLCQRPPAQCQTHHITDWAAGGRTDLDNLVLLCWTHHRQVELNRWTLTRNPDTAPDQPHWLITPVPRHQWKRRPPATSTCRH